VVHPQFRLAVLEGPLDDPTGEGRQHCVRSKSR
jgi:hypothetical protein